MAPRGGGRSGGGGGGDDSGSGDSFSDNPWFATSELFGTHFHDSYALATIVFTGIWLACLFAIAVWAKFTKKQGETTRSILKVNKFGIAIFFALIFFAFSLAQQILNESEAQVANVYFIIAVIINSVSYIAGIWLLVTIYALKFQCHVWADDASKPRKRNFLNLHYLVCAILFVLYVAILILQIRDIVVQVNGSGGAFYRTSVPVANKLDVTFDAIYFVASVEILFGSVWALVRSRGSGRSSKTDGLFIVLVAAPLFLRRVIYLGFDATYEINFSHIATEGGILAEFIIVEICLVVIYGGIVFIASQWDKVREAPWIGNYGPNYAPDGTFVA